MRFFAPSSEGESRGIGSFGRWRNSTILRASRVSRTMPLRRTESNGAVTGVYHHAQSAASNTNDDAGQAVVTGPTRAGDFALTPGVVGAAGPEFGTDR
jgi:hypothetical protein